MRSEIGYYAVSFDVLIRRYMLVIQEECPCLKKKNTVEYLRVMEYIAGKRHIEMR